MNGHFEKGRWVEDDETESINFCVCYPPGENINKENGVIVSSSGGGVYFAGGGSSADYADSRTLEEREAEDKRMVECRSHIDSLYEKKST